MRVTFIAKDAVRVEHGDTVLTCYRTNLDGKWTAVFADHDGVRDPQSPLPDEVLTDEILRNIAFAEKTAPWPWS